jgi:cobalt-zinc-cadmium efflux system outer membrane protein
LEQTAAGRLRFPEPVVSAGLKRADNTRGDTDAGPVVSLTLPLPLFNRGTTEVQRFQAEETRARARRDVLAQQITAQVEGAYQTLLIRQRAADGYQKEISSRGADLTRIVQVAYQEGELGILELLDALRVSRQSQLRLLELQGAAREAEIELERVVGVGIEK